MNENQVIEILVETLYLIIKTSAPMLIASLVIGLVLSVAAILWMEIFDTRIKTPEQIKTSYDEPLLGEIPSLEEEV